MHVKTAILSALIILAVAIGSADILEAYGTTVGDSNVSGPTFYAAEIDDELTLKINKAPISDQKARDIQVGSDYSSEFFVSPNLEGKNWYEMKIDFYVKAKAVDDTSSGNIQASLLYDTESSSDNLICSTDIYVNATKYSSQNSSCTSEDNIQSQNITGFTYKLDGGREKKFNITADSTTRVEVNKK